MQQQTIELSNNVMRTERDTVKNIWFKTSSFNHMGTCNNKWQYEHPLYVILFGITTVDKVAICWDKFI